MPELPEVETIRRTLWPHIEGRTIIEARITEARLPQNKTGRAMETLLTGRRFHESRRRGKFLLFTLSGGDGIVLHLRMTGQLLYRDAAGGREPEGHPHRRMWLALDGDAGLELRDQRRFATLHWVDGGRFDGLPALKGMGPEPLDAEFTPSALGERLAGRRAAVKTALLNQKCVAGLGNIYADEALFRARIDPRRPGGSLKPREIRRLHGALVEVLREALERGGSSIRTYRTGEGQPGSFQDVFNVYGRTGLPCVGCGQTLVRETIGGRSTWWCRRCQK